jgi:uncharacterized cupin superfamily protein
MATEEARLEQTESGLKPASEGWFVVNVGETAWAVHDAFGSGCSFESREAPFRQFGINVNALEPGQPLCLYHEESAQEDFLVLAGECVLLVNGEERPLEAWDFFHCPPGVEHVIVGAGDGLSLVLAVGARPEEEHINYPKSELAERYGASAVETTTDPQEAYSRAGHDRPRHERPAYWDKLPWAE